MNTKKFCSPCLLSSSFFVLSQFAFHPSTSNLNIYVCMILCLVLSFCPLSQSPLTNFLVPFSMCLHCIYCSSKVPCFHTFTVTIKKASNPPLVPAPVASPLVLPPPIIAVAVTPIEQWLVQARDEESVGEVKLMWTTKRTRRTMTGSWQQ